MKPAPRRARRALPSLLAIAAAAAVAGPAAQPMSRRATTVAAIQAYPAFYHAQTVVVRAAVQREGQRATVVWGPHTIRALLREPVQGDGEMEIRGEVWDIGRMNPDDPRLASRNLEDLAGVDLVGRWPRPGEIVILVVTGALPAEPAAAPSIRTIALDPDRYEGQRVTVSGQFRGRNLFGDLPQAPPEATGREEWVLRSADAAIWFTGKRPRGRGFALDPTRRLDTQRWLEASGIVRQGQGLVWVEVQDLQETAPQAEARIEPPPPPPPIPPEVLFSVQTAQETDVALDTNIRIQFSRDLDPETLRGRIRVSYVGQQAVERGEPQAPAIEVRHRYNPGARVLELAFPNGLERFRTVTLELLDGIKGTDGAPLQPWTLQFSTGG